METPERAGAGVIKTADSPNIVPASPYSGIRREISEDDLQSPAVQRILLGEVDKLESRVGELESVVARFHISDKRAAVLEEKLKNSNAGEILYSFCLTVGSVIIGFSSILWTHGYGPIAIFIGGALLVGGIVSKVITWHS